jgi:hypothetical protein
MRRARTPGTVAPSDATAQRTADAGGSPLERALVTIIAASTHLKPDALGPLVAEAGGHLGGRDTRVLVADLSQRALVPLAPGDAEETETMEGSAAGTAFRTEAPVHERVGAMTRLWLPVLDSAERVGVLETTVEHVDADALRSWALVASLVGELVVTKARYGDAIVRRQRVRPVSLAAELRYGLLPPLTFTAPDVLVSAIVEPAYGIAGDTFDYAVDERTAHVALFDAMGHGLEASRMANLAVSAYRHGRRRGALPRECAVATDQAIEREFGDLRFITGHIAALDLVSGVLTAVNAGHPPAVVFHADGRWDELSSGRMLPLGLGGSPASPVGTRLEEGDVVLFHTDGVTEARSATGEFFGDDRLRDTVGRHLAAGLRPAELLRLVATDLAAHQPVPRDDATLLVLGWRPGRSAIPPSVRDL